VLGRATVLSAEQEHDGLPAVDAIQARPRNHDVRLGCEQITGRRIARVESSGQ
jgi:hypothetical protein